MEQSWGMRKAMVKVMMAGVLMILLRFAYVVTMAGESCSNSQFCFFSINSLVTPISSSPISSVHFYSSVFTHLLSLGYLSLSSKSLCFQTPRGDDVFALKEMGVSDSIGVFTKPSTPNRTLPFLDHSFDFVFSGGGTFDSLFRPFHFASEIVRTLKPQGFVVVHVRAHDSYSFNSFLDLFASCRFVTSRDLEGLHPLIPPVREIVLQKQGVGVGMGNWDRSLNGMSGSECSVPGHKLELVQNAEPLIQEEPLKPWITLKRNIKNVKYLASMADISFKNRYVYVDVGARSYGSSIGSWFKKQYPKQNRTFDIYAIEADKTFHQEYKAKKGIRLVPYAAWVRNETLSFEINGDHGEEVSVKGRGMGRIQPVQRRSGGSFNGEVDEIQGFDFAEWLKRSVGEQDFVVMKMDVEGTEFELIPRLFETGAICLIDELFLECHYNRWQRCCPGQRSAKYDKTYGQCLELFNSLRQSGVLVHQWW